MLGSKQFQSKFQKLFCRYQQRDSMNRQENQSCQNNIKKDKVRELTLFNFVYIKLLLYKASVIKTYKNIVNYYFKKR
jgi:hypothetical protein